MKTIYILYANKPGNPDYLEDIITETTDLKHLEAAKKWAADNGFISLRIVPGKTVEIITTILSLLCKAISSDNVFIPLLSQV